MEPWIGSINQSCSASTVINFSGRKYIHGMIWFLDNIIGSYDQGLEGYIAFKTIMIAEICFCSKVFHTARVTGAQNFDHPITAKCTNFAHRVNSLESKFKLSWLC